MSLRCTSWLKIINKIASMAERLTCVPRMREVESSFTKGRPNFTRRCKRFVTASTSTQVAVLPWRYDAETGSGHRELVTRFSVIQRV